jgi:hypothetical protein
MADEDQIQNFIDTLSSDPDLLNDFRESPADVIEQHGIELTDEQREKLEAEDWSAVSDDDVIDRLSTRGASAWL